MSSNGGVEKSDCTVEERHPVSFLVAAGLDHSVAKAAPQNVHSLMEGVGGVFHAGQQFGQHPLLHQLLQVGQLRANNRRCFPDSVCWRPLLVSSALMPVPWHTTAKKMAPTTRLIKHQEQPVAYIEDLSHMR